MFSQVFIRSTTCRLNSTVCRRHFAILPIVPPFAAKCVFWACLKNGVHSISHLSLIRVLSVFIGGRRFGRLFHQSHSCVPRQDFRDACLYYEIPNTCRDESRHARVECVG